MKPVDILQPILRFDKASIRLTKRVGQNWPIMRQGVDLEIVMTNIVGDVLHHRANPVWKRAALVTATTGLCVLIWALAILLPGIGQELLFAPETAFAARLIVAATIVFLGLPFLLLSGVLLHLAAGSLRKIRLSTELPNRDFAQKTQARSAS